MTDLPAPQTLPRPNERRPDPKKWRVIMALMLREMSTRYGRNPGGYFWAILEPLGMIIVLSVGFSLLLRAPALGTSFILFYATGFLPFTLFMRTSNATKNALQYSRGLLNYPVVSWFDAVAARALTNLVTNLTTACLVLVGILIYLPGLEALDPAPIFGGFFAAFVFGVGLGLLNAVIAGFFPVWSTLWGIATAPIFIMSAVIWIYEDLPPLAKDFLFWNPLVHVSGQVRSGFFVTYEPEYVSLIFVWGVALSTLALGLLLMRRFHREILQNR